MGVPHQEIPHSVCQSGNGKMCEKLFKTVKSVPETKIGEYSVDSDLIVTITAIALQTILQNQWLLHLSFNKQTFHRCLYNCSHCNT